MFESENYRIPTAEVTKTESFNDIRKFVIGFSIFISTVTSSIILIAFITELIHGSLRSPRREKNKMGKSKTKIVIKTESSEELNEETEIEEREEQVELGEDVAEPEEEPVSEEGEGQEGDQASIKLEIDQTTTQCDETAATNFDSQGTSGASSIGSHVHLSETFNMEI